MKRGIGGCFCADGGIVECGLGGGLRLDVEFLLMRSGREAALLVTRFLLMRSGSEATLLVTHLSSI